MINPVGPILRMGDEVEPVIAAVEEDNPDTEIEVIDRGAYVRIHAEGELRLTQETLRRHLHEDFEIRSFETMMTAFKGRVVTSSDAIIFRTIASRGEAIT